MPLLNSTNLQQFEGGAIVKQGDSASLFGYELLDEQMQPINELTGKNATIRVFNQKGKLTFDSVVEKSKVTFKLEKVLPVGIYLVEVICDGYIFPSDRSARLEVIQSADQYTTEEVVSLVKNDVQEEIGRFLKEYQDDEMPDLTTLYNLAKI